MTPFVMIRRGRLMTAHCRRGPRGPGFVTDSGHSKVSVTCCMSMKRVRICHVMRIHETCPYLSRFADPWNLFEHVTYVFLVHVAYSNLLFLLRVTCLCDLFKSATRCWYVTCSICHVLLVYLSCLNLPRVTYLCNVFESVTRYKAM